MLDLAKAGLAIHDSMAIAVMTMKNHYDQRQTTRFLKVGGYVSLDLNQRLSYH